MFDSLNTLLISIQYFLIFESNFTYKEMHKPQMHHQISFEECIHHVTQTSVKIESVTVTTKSAFTPSEITSVTSVFFPHCRLVLPILEHHINGILQYAIICIRLLSGSVIFLMLIQFTALLQSILCSIVCSVVYFYIIHSSDVLSGFYQFKAILNKA